MNNKKGFTIIEIIISLTLIVLIGTISIIYLNKDKNSKEKNIKSILNAADVYYSTNKNNIKELLSENYGFIVLNISEIKDSGLLKLDYKLPDNDNENEDYTKMIIFDDNYLGENPFDIESEKIGDINFIYPYVSNKPKMINLTKIELYDFEYDYFKRNSTDESILNKICSYNLTDNKILYFDKDYKVTLHDYECNFNNDKKLTYHITDGEKEITKDREITEITTENVLKIMKENDELSNYDGKWTNKNIIYGYNASNEIEELKICGSNDMGFMDCSIAIENVTINDYENKVKNIRGKIINFEKEYEPSTPIYGSYNITGKVFSDQKKTISKAMTILSDKIPPTISSDDLNNSNLFTIEDNQYIGNYIIKDMNGNTIKEKNYDNSLKKEDTIDISDVKGSFIISVEDKAGNKTTKNVSHYSFNVYDISKYDLKGIYNNLLILGTENGNGRTILKAFNVKVGEYSSGNCEVSSTYGYNDNKIVKKGNSYYIEESYYQRSASKGTGNFGKKTWYNYYKLTEDGIYNSTSCNSSSGNNFETCIIITENGKVKSNNCSSYTEANGSYYRSPDLVLDNKKIEKINQNKTEFYSLITSILGSRKHGRVCSKNCDSYIGLVEYNNKYPIWEVNEDNIDYYIIPFYIRYTNSYSSYLLLAKLPKSYID